MEDRCLNPTDGGNGLTACARREKNSMTTPTSRTVTGACECVRASGNLRGDNCSQVVEMKVSEGNQASGGGAGPGLQEVEGQYITGCDGWNASDMTSASEEFVMDHL